VLRSVALGMLQKRGDRWGRSDADNQGRSYKTYLAVIERQKGEMTLSAFSVRNAKGPLSRPHRHERERGQGQKADGNKHQQNWLGLGLHSGPHHRAGARASLSCWRSIYSASGGDTLAPLALDGESRSFTVRGDRRLHEMKGGCCGPWAT
jgi:hypothetical protein